MAASYYRHIKNEYGSCFRFFGGDPFHEGGISKGVDLGAAGQSIYQSMTDAFPRFNLGASGMGRQSG